MNMEIKTPGKAPDPEIVEVESGADEIVCDGGGGALGHPAVWYVLGGGGRAECLYCDRVFVRKNAAGIAAAH